MKSKRAVLFQIFILVILGFFTIHLFGCQKDEPGGGGSSEALTFPLKVGNSWKYYTLAEMFDSTGNLMNKEEYNSYWSVEKDTMLLGEKAFKIKFTDSSFDNTIQTNYAYYVQKGSGIYGIAFLKGSSSYFHLKTGEHYQFSLHALSNSFGKNGELFFPDSALYLLKYPLKQNEAWSSNEYGMGFGWRRVIGKESVTTQVGTFSCYKIKFWMEGLSSPDERDLFYYYGAKGLIQYTENMELNNSFERSTLIRKSQLVSTNF